MKLIKSKLAFTLIEIMIVVAIIGLLAAIAIPNFVRARIRSQAHSCVYNLRQIDAAKEQWAIENNKAAGSVPGIDALTPYVRGGIQDLRCPGDPNKTFASSYDINQVGQDPVCRMDAEKHKL